MRTLYHSAWVFERYRHSVQTPCTLSGAFEARVYQYQGSLEIPCLLKFQGKADKVENLATLALSMNTPPSPLAYLSHLPVKYVDRQKTATIKRILVHPPYHLVKLFFQDQLIRLQP